MDERGRKIMKTAVLFISLCVIGSFLWWSFFWTAEVECPDGGFWDIDAETCVYPQNVQAPGLPPASAAGR